MPLEPNARNIVLGNRTLVARMKGRQRNVLAEMQRIAQAEIGHHNTQPKDLHESWVAPPPTVQGGDLVAIVGNDAPHVTYIVRGTRPHVIKPKPTNQSGRLHFFWPKVGYWVHPKLVHHPGTRANDFMQRALAKGAAKSP